MNYHVRAVHEGVKIPCRFCALQFGRLSDRNRHERTVHRERTVPDGDGGGTAAAVVGFGANGEVMTTGRDGGDVRMMMNGGGF